jgi:hypothetical protein
MSKFLTNSSGTMAVRFGDVRDIRIVPRGANQFVVVLKSSAGDVDFETSATLVAAQELAVAIIAAVDAAE